MQNIFSFDVEWNYRKVALFVFLIAVPNVLGLVNFGTLFGFKIHVFQIAVFLAAIIFGPSAGLLSGLIGSLYSAAIMNNPYLVVGNMILGFFTGLFVRYGIHTVIAAVLAYLVQLPWLIVSDYYFVHLPWSFLVPLIIALAISNIIWAFVAHYMAKPIMNLL